MKQTGRSVALIYDAIYPYVKGGGERRFYEMAKRLSAEGYDVHLYGMKYWSGSSVMVKDGITFHGLCKARPLYTKSGRRRISEAIIFGVSCFKLLTEKLDIIDCCGFPYFSLFPCRLVALVKRKPLYATCHEVWGKKYWREYLGLLGYFGYRVEWLVLKLPSSIIAVSNQTAERIREIVPGKPIHIITNGVDINHIISLKPSAHNSDIVFAGRLTSTKNVRLLIEAIDILRQVLPEITCRIIGDGPDRNNLEVLVNKLGLKKNVFFAGFIENHDTIIRIMKASRVFVLPSNREGFGLVVIEANAAGLPVVTVDANDNAARQLIDPDNGIITKPVPSDLAQAIQRALANKFDANTCISSARRYDWNQIIGKFKEVAV
jgi:glycosyltransferase involved in cell wall biosynthesis